MLTEKQKRQIAKYEEDLAMPKWKYVLVNGLIFSILLVISNWISDFIRNDKSVSEVIADRPWKYLITIPLSTFLFGFLMHWFISIHYRKLKNKELIK